MSSGSDGSGDADRERSPARSTRTFWFSVIASIVASFIVGIFFQPLIGYVNEAIIIGVSSVYKGYVNAGYHQATLSTEATILFFIYTYLLIIPLGVVLTLLLVSTVRTKSGSLSRFTRNPRYWRRAAVIWVALAVPLHTVTVNGYYVAIQAKSTFAQQMMALDPYMDDQERKSLLRLWSFMQTQADYEKIKEQLSGLAKKYGTTLPSPLI